MSAMQAIFNAAEAIKAEMMREPHSVTCVCPALAALAAFKRAGLLNEDGEALFNELVKEES